MATELNTPVDPRPMPRPAKPVRKAVWIKLPDGRVLRRGKGRPPKGSVPVDPPTND